MNCGSCGRTTSRLLSRCLACGAEVARPPRDTAGVTAVPLDTMAANAPTIEDAEAPVAIPRPSGVAVDVNTFLISCGLPMNSRRIDRNAAIAPETCGAAMLVPLSSM